MACLDAKSRSIPGQEYAIAVFSQASDSVDDPDTYQDRSKYIFRPMGNLKTFLSAEANPANPPSECGGLQ